MRQLGNAKGEKPGSAMGKQLGSAMGKRECKEEATIGFEAE